MLVSLVLLLFLPLPLVDATQVTLPDPSAMDQLFAFGTFLVVGVIVLVLFFFHPWGFLLGAGWAFLTSNVHFGIGAYIVTLPCLC